MLTARQLRVDRAILAALAAVPEGMLLGEETLHADAARMVVPRPSIVELDVSINSLQTRRRIAGIAGESGMQWQITDAGRLWLAQNP